MEIVLHLYGTPMVELYLDSLWPSLLATYKKPETSFWTVEKMGLSEDRHNWIERMNDNERRGIFHVSVLFAVSDSISTRTWSNTFRMKRKRLRPAASTVSRL